MDEEGVRRIADSFMRGDLVSLIRIRDTTNQQILFEAHETGLDDLLFKERPIVFNQRVIGSVTVGLTPRPYENRLDALLRSNLRNTLLIVVILAIITGLFVRRYLRHPLDLLIQGIETAQRTWSRFSRASGNFGNAARCGAKKIHCFRFSPT